MKKYWKPLIADLILLTVVLLPCFRSAAFCRGEKLSSVREDVVHLGSPIRIETTVEQGWDNNGEEIMAVIASCVEQAGVEEGMDSREAIRRINKFLCDHIAGATSKNCRTIRGALVERGAVCVGYTLAFMYMCHYCGIDAVYVHGVANHVRHAWNGVYFADGTYLEVDVCFNDDGTSSEKYLLIPAEEMDAYHNGTAWR